MKISAILSTVIVLLTYLNPTVGSGQENETKFGHSGPFLQIDQADSMPTKKFFDEYVKPKRALLIKATAKSSPAFELWSDSYLKQAAQGHDDYKVVVETIKKESRDQEILNIPFSEFLGLYRNREVYMVNEVPLYLRKDVVLPQPLQCKQASTTLEETIMWFSSGGTKSVVHTDDYENMLCMFDGTKDVILVDYYKHKAAVDSLIDEPKGSYSRVDVDNVDFVKYATLKDLEYYRVTLNPGDCLYIPFKWLHQVRSYDRNVAVNFWFNFEKIFGNSEFDVECENNKLDMSMRLSSLNYTSSKSNHELSFKHYIARQVNLGSRNLQQWRTLFLSEWTDQDEEKGRLEEMITEFFNFIDFNGDGHLSDDEVLDLDENSMNQMYGILDEIDAIVHDMNHNENESDVNEKNEL